MQTATANDGSTKHRYAPALLHSNTFFSICMNMYDRLLVNIMIIDNSDNNERYLIAWGYPHETINPIYSPPLFLCFPFKYAYCLCFICKFNLFFIYFYSMAKKIPQNPATATPTWRANGINAQVNLAWHTLFLFFHLSLSLSLVFSVSPVAGGCLTINKTATSCSQLTVRQK